MKKITWFLIPLLFTSCNEAQKIANPEGTLISNVNIINVKDGSILKSHDIVITSEKIVQIAEQIENPEAFAMIIDGKGKYIIPGLAEMHAHIPPSSISKRRTKETLFLYLSNGITTIRGMLGDPFHLVLQEKAMTEELLSPRIFTSSPSLNGNTISTPAEARRKVIAYKEKGYDFLKIHPGITLEAFDELVKTANEVGIKYAGHVPVKVGIRHALESQYASIDHVDGFLEGLVPDSENVDPKDNGFFGYDFTPLADSSKIEELVNLSKENGVWIVPTQSLFERWFSPIEAKVLLQQPEMKYMPASTLENWKKRKEQSTGFATKFDPDQWEEFNNIRRQLIKELQENGHGILLGSDAPQLFNVPGFSIQHEMAAMEKAGLTPLQIIQAGTINPATFFNMESTFGEIKEGMDADMVLVDMNPLEDISALKNISGVMVRGIWLDRKSIDDKLAKIAENAAQK